MRIFIAALAAATLAACGGGGSDATPEPAKPALTNIVFVGNSLTRHPPLASIGWTGDWGMAASSQDKDFVHRVGAAQALAVSTVSGADNERDASAPLPEFSVNATTIVVIQLGDNGLPAKYAELVAKAKPAAKLVCLSSWRDVAANAFMRTQCESGGGRWVDITDLQRNTALLGVFGHPNDEGMAQIASRINTALK